MTNRQRVRVFPISSFAILALLMAPQVRVGAEDKLPAGHSSHGEAFNEGPRQKAYLMGGTGRVNFPVTVSDPQAQEFFNQGVGQLHGFWYFEAERTFRQVAAMDPECAMAYWGMAMANFGNEERARGFIAKAVQKKENGDGREQLWIDSVAKYLAEEPADRKERRREFLRDIENIIHEYPDDIEAKAFLGVFVWKFKGDLPIPSHEAIWALLSQVFAAEPMHPAHHYVIHLWDREKPERALAAAARSGQSSPSIAHQWHMAGHNYSRLHRYADAAWQQEASARVDHKQMVRDRLLPDQISNFAHNNEWLTTNLGYIGRVHDALDLAKNMIELPRHPKYNTLDMPGRSASYGRVRLFELLDLYEMWDELIGLSETVYLEPTGIRKEQRRRLRALGRAHFAKDDRESLKKCIRQMKRQLDDVRAERKAAKEKAVTEAREKNLPEEGIHKARVAVREEYEREVEVLKGALTELRGYQDILLEAGEAGLKQLAKVDRLDKTVLLRAHVRVGKMGRAEELAKEIVDDAENEVVPLANYIHILEKNGKSEEADKAFEQLREISSYIDIDTPPFERLAPIARRLGLPAEWRAEIKLADDLGERPSLADLGPFRWSPPEAPAWELASVGDQTTSLVSFNGQPVIVIFYLGYGCLHCVEQIVKFAPEASAFEAEGVSLVAISTEDQEAVGKSIAAFEKDIEGEFPFPLLADPELAVFKQYRAYDDFESQPLHGTFLIDGDGKVLWHDVSYEPFTDVEFLKAEVKRLLGKRAILTARF